MIKCDNQKCFWNNKNADLGFLNADNETCCLKEDPSFTVKEFTPGKFLTCLDFEERSNG